MKNILVGIDFHEKTDVLIDKAIEVANAFGAKIWLIHITSTEPDYVTYAVGPQYIRDFPDIELKSDHKLLADYVDQIKKKNLDADGMVVTGATAETIIAESQKLGIDLIICGHHEHGALSILFFGSNSYDIINQSSIPVLAVPL